MAEYDSFKVLQVACPKCGVAAGEDCLTAKGAKTGHHVARKAMVYPRFGKSTSGSNKQGMPSPVSDRQKLRKEVLKLAMDWSGAERPYPADHEPERLRALGDACRELALHRHDHPNVRG